MYKKALSLLAARDYSEADLVKKLRARFQDEDPAPIIAALKRQGALNDRRFAANFVDRRSSMSPERLRRELVRRGIDEDVIDAALGAAARRPSLREVLEATMINRKLTAPLSLRDAARLARALGRLGYPEDDIREELERLHEQ
jgi:regulatory protein